MLAAIWSVITSYSIHYTKLYEARRQLAQKTQARFQRLFAKEAVTAQEFDQVNAELEMASYNFV